MNKKLFLFILLCLSVIFCTKIKYPISNQENLSKKVYIDTKFTSSERRKIEEALNNWKCSTNSYVHYMIVGNLSTKEYEDLYDENTLFIEKTNSYNPIIVEENDKKQDHSFNVVGYYQRNLNKKDYILIVDDLIGNDELFFGVVLHELGHSYGLVHSLDPNAIMYPTLTHNLILTKQDLENFCDAYKCDASKMLICNY